MNSQKFKWQSFQAADSHQDYRSRNHHVDDQAAIVIKGALGCIDFYSSYFQDFIKARITNLITRLDRKILPIQSKV
jgi:hypothetical protein